MPNKPITFRSKSELARSLGVHRNTAIAWCGRPDFPGGNDGPWKLALVVPWLLARGGRAAVPEDDPLLSDEDGESPGLERYRQAKAALAELELEERKRSLLSLDKARSALIRWATIIRHLGERLGKRFGNEAAEAVNDALSECQHVIDNDLGTGQPADDCAT